MKATVTVRVEFEDGQIIGEKRDVSFTPHSGNCQIEIPRAINRAGELIGRYLDKR